MRPKQTIGKRLLSLQKRNQKIRLKKTIANIQFAVKMFECNIPGFLDKLEEEIKKNPVVKMMEEKKIIAEVIGKGGNAK